MKRYFSHYSYIYPDIYLKNHIVEFDEEDDKIINVFPFEKELENTEFYTGLLIFVKEKTNNSELMEDIKSNFYKKYLIHNINYSIIKIR